MPIEIAGITLSRIHKIATLEKADFVRHRIPGLEGDIVQDMGRGSVRLEVEGIYYGTEAGEDLEALRDVYKAREAVDFLAEIVGEAYFAQVILENLEVRQLAGEPDQFSYRLVVAEYVEPPEPEIASPSLVDASILDDALAFADAIELPGLLSLPEITDPLEPLGGLVDGAVTALDPISENEDEFSSPNVFDDLDESLSNDSLDTAVSDLNDSLGAIESEANNLENPPTEDIGQLTSDLSDIDLPESTLPASYGNTLSEIQNGLPTGGSEELLQNINTQLGDLENHVSTEISEKLTPVKDAYTSAGDLIRLTKSNIGFGSGSSEADVASRSLLGSSEDSGELVRNIQAVIDFLDSFGDTFVVENVIEAFHGMIQRFPRGLFVLPQVPFLDELNQVLETALAWRDMTGNEIAQQLQQTLQNGTTFIQQQLDQFFQTHAGQIDNFLLLVDTTQLNTLLNSFQQRLQELETAIEQNQDTQVSQALTELSTLQGQILTVLNTIIQQRTFAQSLPENLDQFHEDLTTIIHKIISTLDPTSDFSALGRRVQAFITQAEENGFLNDLTAPLNSLASDLSALFDKLDLSVIEGPISTAASETQNFVDLVNGSYAQLIAEVSSLFDQLDQLVNQIDVEALMDSVLNAVSAFRDAIRQLMDQAFAPIRDAIAAVIQTISDAVGAFSPEDILNVFRAAIQSISDILQQADVLDAINQIRSTLEEVGTALDGVSFRTLNDLIIEKIELATGILSKLDLLLLNDELKSALQTAVAVLPDENDFDNFRETLIGKLDELMTEGPVMLVDNISEQPQKLMDTLDQYSPQNLIGDTLSGRFDAIIQQMEPYSPLSLLEPVSAQLEQIREEVRSKADPEPLLQPLVEGFDQAMQTVQQMDPSALISPINQAVSGVIDNMLEALPLDDFFDIVDEVLEGIQSVIEGLDAIKCLIDKVNAMLGELANDPDSQVDNWIAQTLSSLNNIPPATDFSTEFTNLQQAIDLTRSAPLLGRILTPLNTLIQNLENLDPQGHLNNLILKRQNIATLSLAGLSPAVQSDVAAFLTGFKPLEAPYNSALSMLGELLEQTQPQPANLSQVMSNWDAQYHAPASILPSLIPADTSVTGIRQLLEETIEGTIVRPLKEVFKLTPKIMDMLNDLLAPVDVLLTDLQTKIGVLITGPASLTTIRDSIDDLMGFIENINLDFLENELKDSFNLITSKLQALSPATLLASLSEAFNEILDSLQLSAFLPQEELNELEAAYQSVLNTLKELDPQKLIVEVIQPEYEELIAPIRELVDLTGIFDTFIDILNRLKSELNDELLRTQEAFLAMLDAIPAPGDLSVSASVSI